MAGLGGRLGFLFRGLLRDSESGGLFSEIVTEEDIQNLIQCETEKISRVLRIRNSINVAGVLSSVRPVL